MQRPATPPIPPAFPASAGMQEVWASVLFAFLVLHLLHQRHEAVGVECRTVELLIGILQQPPADDDQQSQGSDQKGRES